MAITQKDCVMAHWAEKRKKAPSGPSNAPPQKYKLMQNVVPQASQRPPQHGRWVARPPPQQGELRYPQQQPTGPRLNAPLQSAQPGPANRCFNCGSTTHFPVTAPKQSSRTKARVLASKTRARARSRWCRSGKDVSTTPPSLTFRKELQS
jgi:hypothetical protein